MDSEDDARRAFMRNLAHELSGPLTPIAGYLRILQGEKLGALSPQQRRVVEAMQHASVRLTRIVENLSDFATLGAPETRLHAEPFDPDRLAEEVVEEQRGAIRDGRLHVEVVPSGRGPVLGDGKKLRQALGNLVSNAVKFSPHGGEVRVEVLRADGRLRYRVWDQGPGIPLGAGDGLFEPLRHARRRAGDDAGPPGSGLGLPVARRIAEAHGGTVTFESPPRTQPVGAGHAYAGALFVLDVVAAGAGP
ncbi:MAG: HAMP domain-containing sensor histidine kinase [Anaeromyxobacter sp.]